MTTLTLTMRAEYVDAARTIISLDPRADIGNTCPACQMLNSELPGDIPAMVNVAPPLKHPMDGADDEGLNEITLPDGRMARAGEKLKLAIYKWDSESIEHAVFPLGEYDIEIDD